MKYGIGLDVGIASVGYATVSLNEKDEPVGILKMGVRIFDAAETPKDGSPLAAPRREARGARRTIRRHKHRIDRIKQLIIESGILPPEELSSLYSDKTLKDVYELRVLGLDEALNARDLSRVLIHLAQHRGFKSNRKKVKEDGEDGLLLQAVSNNTSRLKENGYRTVGEMFLKDPTFSECKRNKGKSYISTVLRSQIEEEARLILNRQSIEMPSIITESFVDKYLDILLSQRPFDVGPGGNSPYGGNQIEKMIGRCTFELEELRAPKSSYSFSLFSMLQDINHIRLINTDTGDITRLLPKQFDLLFKEAHSTDISDYAVIRKKLSLPDNIRFNAVNYRFDKSVSESESSKKVRWLNGYHEIRKSLAHVRKDRILDYSEDQLNAVAYAFTVFKTDNLIVNYLSKNNIPNPDIEALLNMKGFNKFGHLSITACKKINPFLKQGLNYNEACLNAGYDFKGHKKDTKSLLLPTQTEDMEFLTSPVVRRSISQTIKVINAIIRDAGSSPTFVNIELAREMSKSFKERNEIKKEQDNNAKVNSAIIKKLQEEYHINNPSGNDILKLKLFEEQDSICPYSLQIISASRLFDEGYVQIDHIVPYSKSFDDSFSNKVLVMTSENQKKGNHLPLEYLSPDRQEPYKVYVQNSVKNMKKRINLLKESLSDEELTRFKERNLQDTKTASRFLYNYINDYLLFDNFSTKDNSGLVHVRSVNGSITSYMRKRWGINKNRQNGDLHHSVDAVVIACITPGMIQRVSSYASDRELRYISSHNGSLVVNSKSGVVVSRFPLPWENFRYELNARLSQDPKSEIEGMHWNDYEGLPISQLKPIFVSRMPKHKVTGPAHKETIYSLDKNNQNTLILKKPLTALTLNSDGEIANYYNPESDTLLYKALKEKLTQYNGNAKEAFIQPFYKPMRNGCPGNLVRTVKLTEYSSLFVPTLNGNGAAYNGSMIRIDVFHIENDGYYFVPIYAADVVKKVIPMKAVVAHKSYEMWKTMLDENFVFSLYPSDLVYVKSRKPLSFKSNSDLNNSVPDVSEAYIYYSAADISSGSISCTSHDRSLSLPKLGIKTLLEFKKCNVDVLGNISFIKKEKRQRFK